MNSFASHDWKTYCIPCFIKIQKQKRLISPNDKPINKNPLLSIDDDMLMSYSPLSSLTGIKIMRASNKAKQRFFALRAEIKGKNNEREYSKITPQFWLGSTGKKKRGHIEAQVVATYLLASPTPICLAFIIPKMLIAHGQGLPFRRGFEGLQSALKWVLSL